VTATIELRPRGPYNLRMTVGAVRDGTLRLHDDGAELVFATVAGPAHARVAQRVMNGTDRAVQVLMAEDGDILLFDQKGARIADKAPTGRVLIDVTRVGEVGEEVLRDRRHLAGDGVVVAVLAISRATGALVGEPEVIARGFVVEEGQAAALFKDAARTIADCVDAASVEERTDQGLMTEKVRIELRRFFKKRSGRRPLVLPVLMEI